jgi:cytochrome P450
VQDGLGDDLISFLLQAKLDGRTLEADEVFGGCLLLLVAGIDTTWSAIGASIWHLAAHPEHQERLRAEPELLPSAVEELLRAYAPVTMAREAVVDTELAGCPVKAGEPLLLPFPAANRDPALFDRPDEVLLDRSPNRHVSFGVGIHRCLGSHLARMEVTVALEQLLANTSWFELADPGAVRWSTGQVRGPRTLPLRYA